MSSYPKQVTNLIYVIALVFSSCALLLVASCNDENACENMECEHGGNCADGICECLDGYSGENCEVEDLCITQSINCLNGGTCTDGLCDCPEGFTGSNCKGFDLTKIDLILEDGVYTPKDMVNAGIPLDSFIGRPYLGGIIFYVDVHDEVEGLDGLVAATSDQSAGIEWGCFSIDPTEYGHVASDPTYPEMEEGARIGDGFSNTAGMIENCLSQNGNQATAAHLCKELGDDWFLPSRGELYEMYRTLYLKSLSPFTSDSFYWSSTPFQEARWSWVLSPRNGIQDVSNRNDPLRVRAVRAF